MTLHNFSFWKPPLAFAAHSFFQIPPRKKSEWRGAARREGGTRGTPRVAGFRRSERTMQFQATTHAERAKSVPLEKGSRKGYDYTARQDLADELLKK